MCANFFPKASNIDEFHEQRIHEHRQQMLMSFCDARLRMHQCCLTLEEEHLRWVNKLTKLRRSG